MALNFDIETDIFPRLRNGEKVICPECGIGHIKPMSSLPLDEESCFECDNCKAHFRYDPITVTVE